MNMHDEESCVTTFINVYHIKFCAFCTSLYLLQLLRAKEEALERPVVFVRGTDADRLMTIVNSRQKAITRIGTDFSLDRIPAVRVCNPCTYVTMCMDLFPLSQRKIEEKASLFFVGRLENSSVYSHFLRIESNYISATRSYEKKVN